jgi:DNA-binding transcriptional MerR regulator
MEQLSIGEFGRRSRLSAKALRLYDELGLVVPASVDPDTGYRSYAVEQVEQARHVALLRQLGVPLAEIKAILALEPTAAAQQIAGYWGQIEAEHADRCQLAHYLIDSLAGKGSAMYEVTTRALPERQLLCLLRHATDQQEVYALGKEFLAIFKAKPLPLMDGIDDAPFLILIYHGEVSEDSDGPVECCRPVPADQAADLAGRYAELALRREPAHEEAFVHLGPAMQISGAQWQLASESLRTWSADQQRLPSDLGLRVTYLARPPITPDSQPDIDFSVPLR